MHASQFFEGVDDSELDMSAKDIKTFKVVLTDITVIRPFIEKWHYSKNVNGLTTDYCFKLIDLDGNMIGAMIYGKIAMANVWKKYTSNLTDLIELK